MLTIPLRIIKHPHHHFTCFGGLVGGMGVSRGPSKPKSPRSPVRLQSCAVAGGPPAASRCLRLHQRAPSTPTAANTMETQPWGTGSVYCWDSATVQPSGPLCQAASSGRSGQPPAVPAARTHGRSVRPQPAPARDTGPGHRAGPAAVPLPAAGRAAGRRAAPSTGGGEGPGAAGRWGARGPGGAGQREGGGARCRRTHRAGRRGAACTSCVLGNERAGPSAAPLKGDGPAAPDRPRGGTGSPAQSRGEAEPPPPHGSREGPRDRPPSLPPPCGSSLPWGGGAARSARLRARAASCHRAPQRCRSCPPPAGPLSAAATPSAPGGSRRRPAPRCPPGQWPWNGRGTAALPALQLRGSQRSSSSTVMLISQVLAKLWNCHIAFMMETRSRIYQ